MVISREEPFYHCIAVSAPLIQHFSSSWAMLTEHRGAHSITQERRFPGGVRRRRKISSPSAAAKIRRATCVASRVSFSLPGNNRECGQTWPDTETGFVDVPALSQHNQSSRGTDTAEHKGALHTKREVWALL